VAVSPSQAAPDGKLTPNVWVDACGPDRGADSVAVSIVAVPPSVDADAEDAPVIKTPRPRSANAMILKALPRPV